MPKFFTVVSILRVQPIFLTHSHTSQVDKIVEAISMVTYHHMSSGCRLKEELLKIVASVLGTSKAVPITVRYVITRDNLLFSAWSWLL